MTTTTGAVSPPTKPAQPRTADDPAWLDAGLAIASRADGLTFIAMPAPVTTAAALASAVEPIFAWTSHELTLVGFGIARELRGRGTGRFDEVIARARGLATARGVLAGLPVSLEAFGRLARPRLVGGAAFAPGAADRAPWVGFGDAWFALPRWTYASDGARACLTLALDAIEATDAARWHTELARFRSALALGSSTPARGAQPAIVELETGSADAWRAQIAAIGDAIASGTCSKIVAARSCHLVLADAPRASDLLAALDDRQADCVRLLVHPPGAGMLVAATPERLVRRDAESVRCDALAGTIRADRAGGSAALLSSTKDRREHELVVSAIRDALERAGATVDAPAEPTVRALRHVLHLHTPFRATLHTPRHVLELAARLHPTPAVGGTPTPTAVDWITKHEPVARGWYASPAGWFDLDGNGELAVAIRSGVFVGNRAHLWAGAGIVSGSDADRELAETDIKLRAMLGALGAHA